MKRTCDVCGLEAEEYWMIAYNTGRGMKWFCWECWKKSQREANLSDRAPAAEAIQNQVIEIEA